MVIIEPAQLRALLASNIRARRGQMGISQEKLAELAEVSTQTINDIERCRSWLSDRTMAKLGEALSVEIFQLFLPPGGETRESEKIPTFPQKMYELKQDIKADFSTYIDARFGKFLNDDP
jgi:transcriptional regulator with XRE-family HTH domain